MKTKKELVRWAEDQISKGTPRQIIIDQLMEMVDKSFGDPFQMRACLDAASEVGQILGTRNSIAKQQEAEGNFEQAIHLYELNVSDKFPGDYTYDRLRIIYSKLGRKEDARRVCKAFIDMAQYYVDRGSKRGDLHTKILKFKKYLEKLK